MKEKIDQSRGLPTQGARPETCVRRAVGGRSGTPLLGPSIDDLGSAKQALRDFQESGTQFGPIPKPLRLVLWRLGKPGTFELAFA